MPFKAIVNHCLVRICYDSFILIGLAFALLALYTRDKLKTNLVIAGFMLLGCFDILGVATRYLNYGNFAEPSDVDAVFTLTEADRQIQADPDKNVRVFDQASGGGSFPEFNGFIPS